MPDFWSKLEALKQRAKIAREHDRFALAIQLFRIFLRYRQEDAFAWFALGDCMRLLGRIRAARTCYRRAMHCAPHEQRYLVEAHLGWVYADWGHHRRAEYYFSSACSARNEQLDWIWLRRGQSCSARERWRAAEAHFSRAIELNSQPWEAHYELGLVLRSAGQYEAARELFGSAIQRAPEAAEPLQALQSLADHEQWPSFTGGDDDALFQHWEDGRTVLVVETLLHTAPALHSERSLTIGGDALRSLGRNREAIRCYAEALRLEAHDPLLTLTGIAMALEKIGGLSRAEIFYAKATELSESHTCAWLWVLRGRNLTRRDRFDSANKCYRQALRIDPLYDEAYLNIGLNLLANGRYNEARKFLVKSCELDDTNEAREAIARMEDAENASHIANEILGDDF